MGQLVGHVFDSAVCECALAFVLDPSEVPDEVFLGCELAEYKLCLGVVQASYGPADLDIALVFLIRQPLGKHFSELLYIFHQDPWWGLLQGDGL